MTDESKGTKYHAYAEGTTWYLGNSSDRELEKWATDPNCLEAEACAKVLAERRARRGYQAEGQTASVPKSVEPRPFDPRTEISADALHITRRIIKHLWILCVGLP